MDAIKIIICTIHDYIVSDHRRFIIPDMDAIDSMGIFKRQVNPLKHRIPFYDGFAEKFSGWKNNMNKG